MKTIKLLIILFVASALMSACLKVEKIPPIPKIEFISFEIFDSVDILQNEKKAGILKFKFEDGDGDIGLHPPHPTDTISNADTTNLKLMLYRKNNGAMQLVDGIDDPMLQRTGYRIPYMERLGQNKILKGEIIITILYQSYKLEDTIKYDFFIIDRAGNISNIEDTPEIIVSENDIYRK